MSGVARTIRMSRPVMSSTPTSYTNGAPKREVGIHNQTLFPEDTHWTLSSAVRLRLREDHVQTSWSVIPIRTLPYSVIPAHAGIHVFCRRRGKGVTVSKEMEPSRECYTSSSPTMNSDDAPRPLSSTSPEIYCKQKHGSLL